MYDDRIVATKHTWSNVIINSSQNASISIGVTNGSGRWSGILGGQISITCKQFATTINIYLASINRAVNKIVVIHNLTSFTVILSDFTVSASNQCYENLYLKQDFYIHRKDLVKSVTLRIAWVDDYARINLNNIAIADYGYGSGVCHRNENGTSNLTYSVPVDFLVEGYNFAEMFLIRYGNNGLRAYLDISYQFANTIMTFASGLGKDNSVSTILNFEFIQYAPQLYYVDMDDVSANEWIYEVMTLTVNLPASPTAYSSVKGYFYIDGCVDDFWDLYLNGSLFKIVPGKWTSRWVHSRERTLDDLIRFQDLTEININTQNITLNLKARSGHNPSAAIVYEAYIKVSTKSK